MESVKVTKTTKDELSKLARMEERSESAIVADMLETYQSTRFKSRVKEIQARRLPSPGEDPEMAEWDRINRLVHEDRANQRSA